MKRGVPCILWGTMKNEDPPNMFQSQDIDRWIIQCENGPNTASFAEPRLLVAGILEAVLELAPAECVPMLLSWALLQALAKEVLLEVQLEALGTAH